MKRWMLAMIVALCATGGAHAQSGYILVGSTDLPNPIRVTAPASQLMFPPVREDVRLLGRGMASTALAGSASALLSNPALLDEDRNSVEAFGVAAGIPPQTLNALGFVSDHLGDFQHGDFLVLLSDGYEQFRTATTLAQRQAGLDKMRQATAFPGDVIREVTGPSGALLTHGIGVAPYVAVQRGPWGFSVQNVLRLGFQVSPGATVEELAGLQLPDVPAFVAPSLLLQVVRALNDAFDLSGNLRAEALPRAFAVTTNDLVASVGRSLRLGEQIRVGATLRVVNRRFSSKLIDPENMSSVLREVRSEFNSSRTGLTGDLGIAYRAGNGLAVGLTAQNLLPLATLASSAQLTYRGTETYYINSSGQPTTDRAAALVGDYDRASNTFTPNSAGDTLIYGIGYTIDARLPLELKTPTLVNVGVAQRLSEVWDVTADWYDVAGQDDRLEGVLPRLRLGTEYRLWNGLLAVRAGLLSDHLSAGVGLELGPVGIDGASATDPFTQVRAWFVQVRVGW